MIRALTDLISALDSAKRLALHKIRYDGEAVEFHLIPSDREGGADAVERWLEQHGEPPTTDKAPKRAA